MTNGNAGLGKSEVFVRKKELGHSNPNQQTTRLMDSHMSDDEEGRSFSYEELQEYFHKPINEVSQELGICATLLKKLCRKNGIKRWPHRKIKSLDTLIDNFEEIIRTRPDDWEAIQSDITKLKQKREFLLANPNVSYNDASKAPSERL